MKSEFLEDKKIKKKLNDFTCKKEVLQLYGIKSDQKDNFFKPKISSAVEKSFCRRNEMTCCKGGEIW